MRILMIGAKSQAHLSYQIVSKAGHTVPYVFDQDQSVKHPGWDCVLFHDDELIEHHARQCDGFLVCIGNIGRGKTRLAFGRRLEALGLEPVSAIHPTTFIPESARIGHGLQTFPRAVIGEFVSIGDYCIIGINAAIDHESVIGSGCHIMGGAALAGEVCVKEHSDVGANATVLPHVVVGCNSIVGAGAVVTKSVPDNTVVAGVPARAIRSTI
jgi:sugar O-acyltransferase (sialic acid O-acetyltransferase NeuD family)